MDTQGLEKLFGYALDNWFICFGILACMLTAHIQRDRVIVLSVVAISLLGHYISPKIFAMDESWKIWGLYGSLVGFIKLSCIITLICINKEYRTRLAELLSFIFLLQIGYHGLHHLDWTILETEYLHQHLFFLNIFGLSISYDAYKLIVQILNILTIVFIYCNWLIDLLGSKETQNGICKSSSNNDDFYARAGGV